MGQLHTTEDLETECESAETLVVDEVAYTKIPKENYIRGEPSYAYWESNYEDRNKEQWVVIKSSTEPRKAVLTKIATHMMLGDEVLWKQIRNVYYIQVSVEGRYMSGDQISENLEANVREVANVLENARVETGKQLIRDHNIDV